MRKIRIAILTALFLLPLTAAQAQEVLKLDYSRAVMFSAKGSSLDSFDVTSPTATVHNILGYSTVALGLLTGVLNPEVVGESLHQALGYTSAGMAAATIGFGFISHIKDIDMSSGLNSNSIHMILGLAGGTMMMIAPFVAPGDAHKALGELGAATMGLSIVGKLVF
ncbi:hypothetical protein [Spirochaeta isovalerica]|uniref:Putative membrane protein n=1 Tax=Spirochaeta isovalerica TaxID=150 RepID=A0A841R6A9_9SPIO|nr:hypothetical protein [Spirochaeta isovalerica]MBB6479373.1 putative membrane protein [Spirochaeta isovalerica]